MTTLWHSTQVPTCESVIQGLEVNGSKAYDVMNIVMYSTLIPRCNRYQVKWYGVYVYNINSDNSLLA